MHNDETWLPLSDALLRLGVGRGRGYHLLLTGKLGPTRKTAGRWYVAEPAVEALAREFMAAGT